MPKWIGPSVQGGNTVEYHVDDRGPDAYNNLYTPDGAIGYICFVEWRKDGKNWCGEVFGKRPFCVHTRDEAKSKVERA